MMGKSTLAGLWFRKALDAYKSEDAYLFNRRAEIAYNAGLQLLVSGRPYEAIDYLVPAALASPSLLPSYLVLFTCKISFRYSRERALQSFPHPSPPRPARACCQPSGTARSSPSRTRRASSPAVQRVYRTGGRLSLILYPILTKVHQR